MDPDLQWESVQWPDGSLYEGLTRGGRCHRNGVLQHANADRFEGEFVDGLEDGHGVYVWRDGTVYRGEWRAGMIHGCGVLLQRAAGAGDGFDVQEGKYLADEYVGPVMSCSKEAAQSAAVEADVAARMAQAFTTPRGQRLRRQRAQLARGGSGAAAAGAAAGAGQLQQQPAVSAPEAGGEGGAPGRAGLPWPFAGLAWPWQAQGRGQQAHQQLQQPGRAQQGGAEHEGRPITHQASSAPQAGHGPRPEGAVGHRTRPLTEKEQRLMSGLVGQLMKAEAARS